MTGIEALRGLPKELRPKVIACIIKHPFLSSDELNRYLSSDISNEAIDIDKSKFKNSPSTIFAVGFNWPDAKDYGINWEEKFKELEGEYWD